MARMPCPQEKVLNDVMRSAVAEFVAAKDRFDVEGRAYIPGSWFHRIKRRVQGWTVPERGWTATFPSKFVERTIPFSEVFFRASKAQPMTIDSRMIVSGAFNYYTDDERSDQAVQRTMDRSDEYACRELLKYPFAPRSCQIGTLPLIVATEGKNRVALFKSHTRPMQSMVAPTAYPDASSLMIHRSWPFKVYSLRFGQCRRVLPLPEAVLPILKAYGVKTSQTVTFSIRDYLDLRRARVELCNSQMGE
ncbi:hypothetical protein M5G27_27815 [Pseudomonas shahriarae]|uniref:Uncharacterized protein n=1 Tax=Pseudomonas shahriarae TaxID=2745512 RepID=A0A9X4HFN2_9PSED|nr:hypothetical protein [Pseudomonas shahriarae]MDD1011282.1 hypothetical protein [Pseudomonas shahriarae]